METKIVKSIEKQMKRYVKMFTVLSDSSIVGLKKKGFKVEIVRTVNGVSSVVIYRK